MSHEQTLAADVPKGQPAGLWVLIFTETFERFSHYGMRGLLILYLTAPVALGGLGLEVGKAGAIFGGYLLSIYLFGLSGGQIADKFLGAKRTIFLGGLLIAAGQLLLQVKQINWLYASLVLISVGTCLLKPNISTSVGRLYAKDDPRRDGAFTLEYMGINVGATIAPFICGYLASHPTFQNWLVSHGFDRGAGWSWAFGVSGVGMLLSLVNFALRRKLIVDTTMEPDAEEPKPQGQWFVALLVPVLLALCWVVVASNQWYVQLLGGAVASFGALFVVQALVNQGLVPVRTVATHASGEQAAQAFTKEDKSRLLVVGMMLCFSMTFWFVFQQAGGTLNLFARDYTDLTLFGWEIPAPWFQSVNAIFIVALGPVFAAIWKARQGRWPSSPVKFAMGILFAALGFFWLIPAALKAQAVPGEIHKVSMIWLVGVYFIHTLGELCISPVGMSYVSKLAPKQVGGQLMGAWFFATGCGSYLAGKAAGMIGSVALWKLFLVCGSIALFMSLLLWIVVSRVIHKMMGGHS